MNNLIGKIVEKLGFNATKLILTIFHYLPYYHNVFFVLKKNVYFDLKFHSFLPKLDNPNRKMEIVPKFIYYIFQFAFLSHSLANGMFLQLFYSRRIPSVVSQEMSNSNKTESRAGECFTN